MVLVVNVLQKGSQVAGVAVFGCKRSLRQFATSAQLLQNVCWKQCVFNMYLEVHLMLYLVFIESENLLINLQFNLVIN